MTLSRTGTYTHQYNQHEVLKMQYIITPHGARIQPMGFLESLDKPEDSRLVDIEEYLPNPAKIMDIQDHIFRIETYGEDS